MKKIYNYLTNHSFFVKEFDAAKKYIFEFKDPKIVDNTYTISIINKYDQSVAFPVWYSIYGKVSTDTPFWLEDLEKEINNLYYDFQRLQMTIHHHRIPITNIFYFSRIIGKGYQPYDSTLFSIQNVNNFKLDQHYESNFQKTKKELETAGYVVHVTSCPSGDGNLLIHIK